MTFIVTAGGDELDVRYPAPGHITAMTIAHHLAQINRFNGAACRPYSVAEHSLLVCEIAERELGLDVHGLMWALMHDAHEAFCGDVVSPNKAELGPEWGHFEASWQRRVCSAFALHTAKTTHARMVHKADLMALATEREALLPPAPTPWPVLLHVSTVNWADLRAPEREAMTWRDWRDRWHDRYEELEYARDARIRSTRHA